MKWVYLLIPILTEVVATGALKASHSFTRLGPSLLTVAGYLVAFYCLSLTLREMPVGVAYAIWCGVGIVLVSLAAALLFGQRLDMGAIVGKSWHYRRRGIHGRRGHPYPAEPS